jgi:hypothetical protein
MVYVAMNEINERFTFLQKITGVPKGMGNFI